MKAFLLRTVTASSVLAGSWLIRFVAWWVATGYFLFRPSRRESSVRLYRAIFPDRSRVYRLYAVWRQFHSFSSAYGDRILLYGRGGLNISTRGRDGLLEAAGKGKGAIIVISHMGNYEIAVQAFQKLGVKLLLMMGEREAKQVAREQRERLLAGGIRIQVSAPGEDSQFGGLEAIQFLRQGGMVSIAGDLVWTDRRSLVPVRFFDREVGFPVGPHVLALVSGAPLFTLFPLRVGKGRHEIIVSPPREVKAPSRSERDRVLQASVQAYAQALEEMVRRHPFQWYIFEPFFPPAAGGAAPSAPGGATDPTRKQDGTDKPNPGGRPCRRL
ncbi:MAG: lysophospholipid acyltransferase family protein [Thermodesulfobacteriota bacterium]